MVMIIAYTGMAVVFCHIYLQQYIVSHGKQRQSPETDSAFVH
jgi:hypothetical protein